MDVFHMFTAGTLCLVDVAVSRRIFDRPTSAFGSRNLTFLSDCWRPPMSYRKQDNATPMGDGASPRGVGVLLMRR
jgi:hypothetical protein